MPLCYFDGTASHTINSFTGGTHQLCISKSNGVTERFPLTNLTTAWLPSSSDRKGGQPVISYGNSKYQIAQSYSMSHSLRASLSQDWVKEYATGSTGYVLPILGLSLGGEQLVRETTYLNAQAENRDYRRCYTTIGQNVSLTLKMLSASQNPYEYKVYGGGPYTRTVGGSISINAKGMSLHGYFITFKNSFYMSQYPNSVDLVLSFEAANGASSTSKSFSGVSGGVYLSQTLSLTYVKYRSSLSTKVSVRINGPTPVNQWMSAAVIVDHSQLLCTDYAGSNLTKMQWYLIDASNSVHMKMANACYGLTASWIRGANSNINAWLWGTNNTSTTWQTITASCSAWFKTSALSVTGGVLAKASTSAWNNINL